MGTFDVNNSARQFQQQSMQTAARAHQQMHRHQQDYKRRIEQLDRSREAGIRQEFPGDEHQARRPSLGHQLLRILKWAGIVLAVLLIAPRVILPLLDESGGPRAQGGEPVQIITGTVVPGSGYNVRIGPSTSTAIAGHLKAGRTVQVSCVSGNWLRLAGPFAGRYVFAPGIQFVGSPVPC